MKTTLLALLILVLALGWYSPTAAFAQEPPEDSVDVTVEDDDSNVPPPPRRRTGVRR